MRTPQLRAWALGALTVATLDGLDAFVFFGLRGVKPGRIFQAIASGILGRASFEGGAATIALGVALHLFIAGCVVAVYLGASRRLPALVQRPALWGPLYGVAVWLTMNFVVIPLSQAAGAKHIWPVVVNGLLIHMLGVGLPSALWARRAALATPRPL